MSYISVEVDVEIDVDDVLHKVSDRDLLQEVKDRGVRLVHQQEIKDTLLNVADYCRSQGRNDYAFRIDEIRSEVSS